MFFLCRHDVAKELCERQNTRFRVLQSRQLHFAAPDECEMQIPLAMKFELRITITCKCFGAMSFEMSVL